MTPARLLQIHVCESDRYGDRPLYQALIDKCRELGLSGATALRGIEGYGASGHIGRAPLLVIAVDTADRIAAAAPALEAMLETGVLAVEQVAVRRVRKG